MDLMALVKRITLRDIALEIPEESVELVLSKDCCIYNVPEYLKKENEDAYTPRLISIGPVHRNNEKLKQLKNQKLLYFQYFRQRLSNDEHLENYTTELGILEPNIRSCYSEEYNDLDKNMFVCMIMVDAAFIMELFLREWEGPYVTYCNDYFFRRSWVRWSIRRDLLLIENQIPFFVLEKLYKLVPASQHGGKHSSFLELACNYYRIFDPYPGIDNKNAQLKQGWDKPKHFTDLVRSFFVPGYIAYESMPPDTYPIIKTATKLKEAGITFEPISKVCLLDVRFKKIPVLNQLCCLLSCIKWVKARLQIPTFHIDGSTECILRNLMVFEQSHCPLHNYVCHYVGLLDRLIQTEQDVDVLVESKVIAHNPGSDKDLAGLINSLGKNVDENMAYYASLAWELDRHYHGKCNCNKTWARLRLVYFTDLWRTTGTIVGFVVLAFAAINFYKAVHDLWLS